MADLIDRAALLEKKTVLWDECLGYKPCVCTDDINAMPAVDAVEFAEDNNVPCKWIPVSERLPDTGGRYLIYGNVIWMRIWLSNFDKELGKFGSWWDYEPDGTKHERYYFIETEVTHWMPLPEPPKEGNNE